MLNCCATRTVGLVTKASGSWSVLLLKGLAAPRPKLGAYFGAVGGKQMVTGSKPARGVRSSRQSVLTNHIKTPSCVQVTWTLAFVHWASSFVEFLWNQCMLHFMSLASSFNWWVWMILGHVYKLCKCRRNSVCIEASLCFLNLLSPRSLSALLLTW